MRKSHGIGKRVVPGPLVVDRIALRVAGGQRLDQGTLRCGRTVAKGKRGAGGVISAGECCSFASSILQFPETVG